MKDGHFERIIREHEQALREVLPEFPVVWKIEFPPHETSTSKDPVVRVLCVFRRFLTSTAAVITLLQALHITRDPRVLLALDMTLEYAELMHERLADLIQELRSVSKSIDTF